MRYTKNSDLPDSLKKRLPKHALDIYREAFNSAHLRYENKILRKNPKDSLEETSHKVAWGAVKRKYMKDLDGCWKLKSIENS